jgi:D-threo-aldose 1-dehydrogenase
VLAHPVIVSVIPGARAEVEGNVALLGRPIPAGLWADLKDAGLLDPAAPTPGSQP